jgi:hypothetical protein
MIIAPIYGSKIAEEAWCASSAIDYSIAAIIVSGRSVIGSRRKSGLALNDHAEETISDFALKNLDFRSSPAVNSGDYKVKHGH